MERVKRQQLRVWYLQYSVDRFALGGMKSPGEPDHIASASHACFKTYAFEHMTVLDNLLLGRHHLYKLGVLHDVSHAEDAASG